MSFAAKYDGPCIYGDDIKQGDECIFTDEGTAHADCQARHRIKAPRTERYVDEIDVAARALNRPLGRNERHCRECNLVHAGACW